MEKKDVYFEPGFKQYLMFFEQAVLDPALFASNLKNLDLKKSFAFFLINAVCWLLLSSLIKTFFLNKYVLFFAVLSETLVLLFPLFITAVSFGILLHIIARVFGSRARISSNLKSVFFSSILLPFFAVPVFKTLAVIISIFILIYCFKTVNRFDRLRASLSVLIPAVLILLVLYSMGILNSNLITR